MSLLRFGRAHHGRPGPHFFTFNQVAATRRWQRQLAELDAD